MESKLTKENKRFIAIAFAAGIVVTVAVAALLTDIFQKQMEGRRFPGQVTAVSDDDVNPEKWGKNYPAQYEDFMTMKEENSYTPFGGSLAYSKLIRYVALVRLWAGYPFSADFNEERTHYYSQIDQRETFRNNKAWLNAHGFPKFKGQPGACMNCHSGWTPKYVRLMGWEGFNKTPYMDIIAKMDKELGKGEFSSFLGGTCADCHSPADMSLRVTRQAYIKAMVARGYEEDPQHGIKATRAEMRKHVCQQCHVEYYFKKETTELAFPWTEWTKDEPLRIEMIEAYYDKIRAAFPFDWLHKETGAEMIKMQHPETEMFSSGIHARSGVGCPDCHMPYKRSGGAKITNHSILSPLLRIEDTCRTCHPLDGDALAARVMFIQKKTVLMLREAELSILALADDIVKAKGLIEKHPGAAGKSPDAMKAYLDGILKEPREFHRKASLRWDFVFSENSTGFHSPQEAARILSQSMVMARRGQLALAGKMSGLGIPFAPTVGAGKLPAPGQPIVGRAKGVGDLPPAELLKLDQDIH